MTIHHHGGAGLDRIWTDILFPPIGPIGIDGFGRPDELVGALGQFIPGRTDRIRGLDVLRGEAGDHAPAGGTGAGRLWPEAGRDMRSGPGNDGLPNGGAESHPAAADADADSFVFLSLADQDTPEDSADSVDRLVIQSGADAWFDLRTTDRGAKALAGSGAVDILFPDLDPARLPPDDFIFA